MKETNIDNIGVVILMLTKRLSDPNDVARTTIKTNIHDNKVYYFRTNQKVAYDPNDAEQLSKKLIS